MKSILIIIPYDPIYPPMNGGMQRCFHILHQLAKHFEVTAIINQDKTQFEKSFSAFPELVSVALYSTKNQRSIKDMFSILPARIGNGLRYRLYKRRWKGTTDSNFLLYYAVLKNLLKKKKFDAVILENLDTINAVDIIRRYDNKTFIVYDTHNVGSQLAEIDLKKGRMQKENVLAIQYVESHLHESVNAVLACSEHDLGEFKKMNNYKLHGANIPNGVHLDKYFDAGVRLNKPEFIIFFGTWGYGPNAEGLEWFYKAVWPIVTEEMPSLKLLVAGAGSLPPALQKIAEDKSLVFTGTIEDVRPWYNKASVAIVPLKSGSGTRLKILEAMGFGLPVVSTAKGAEGIIYDNGSDIVIADDAVQFAHELIGLLKDKDKRLSIQKLAGEMVKEKYDWNVIGTKMACYLHQNS